MTPLDYILPLVNVLEMRPDNLIINALRHPVVALIFTKIISAILCELRVNSKSVERSL